MKNPIQSAGEAVPNISRRKALGLLVAATASPTIAVAATPPSELRALETTENPALLLAFDRFNAARAEAMEAKSALEWLVDEWRHVWPLAPEEILSGTNAHLHGSGHSAERDIIGNYLMRDTSGLTSRLSREQRAQLPNTCFFVITPNEAGETIEAWASHPLHRHTGFLHCLQRDCESTFADPRS